MMTLDLNQLEIRKHLEKEDMAHMRCNAAHMKKSAEAALGQGNRQMK